MPEERLAGERLNQHRKGVVALAHVRRVDLAGVAGEHHLGAFADARENRLQRRRLQVLRFVDHHELPLQRPPAQERDRLERQLPAIREVFDQAARVATRAFLRERDDRVVDRRHPRVELFFQAAGQEPHVGTTHRHERAIHREAFVPALLHHLLETGGDGHHRLAGAGTAVERDHRDVGVEQQLESEALFFVARAQPPGLGVVGVQHVQRPFAHASQRRLRAVAQDREVVVVERLGTLDGAEVGGALRIQRIHGFGGGLQRDPTHGLVGGRTRHRVVFAGGQPEVRRLDAQGGVVRHQAGGGDFGLADGRPDDAVVRHVRVEPVVLEALAIDVVHLDVQGARVGVVGERGGLGQRPAGLAAQFFDVAQRGARRATDVVHASFQTVEFFHHGERNHDGAPSERVHRRRVCDQHRRVEHDTLRHQRERHGGSLVRIGYVSSDVASK